MAPDVIGTPIPPTTPPVTPTVPPIPTGTPVPGVVPYTSAEHMVDKLAVSLPRYAQIVDYSEAALFGVRQTLPQGQREYTCQNIWSRWQRQALARELMSAQGEFWKRCGYPFVPTWIDGERHEYSKTILLDNCRVIALGKKVDTLSVSGWPVTYGYDPAVITVNLPLITDLSTLHIFHPGTDYEIIPSSIVFAGGGDITIQIPRARMVALANDDNPEDGWDYNDTSLFEQTVDIRWIYLDPAYQVNVFGRHGHGWSNYWQDGYLRSGKIGHVKLARIPPANFCDCEPAYLQVSYLCGLPSLSTHAEDAIIRLAHSRMPSEPCGCDFLKAMWERDRQIPDVLDAAREDNLWGMSNGAWQAWKFAQDMVCYRARTL